MGYWWQLWGTWLCFVQQQQLCLGQSRVHAHSPAFACHRAHPSLQGRAVWSWKLSCACVPERGREGRAKASREEGRERRELSWHTAEGSQRQAVCAALRLVCTSKDSIHWLYPLNPWRTDMTPNCCFYMLLLIGTKGKCPWLPFLFWTLQSRELIDFRSRFLLKTVVSHVILHFFMSIIFQ